MAALIVPGCTRLNGAFEAADGDTGGSTTEPPTDTAEATTTPDDSATDGGATEESGDESEDSSDAMACVEPSEECVLFIDDHCPPGEQCRPWSNDIDHGVGCVRKPDAQPLTVGARCEHACDGEIGIDRCPPATICDPHDENPRCIPLCGDELACNFGQCEDYGDYGLCRPECDLLAQDCPDALACLLGPSVPYCGDAGDAADGAPCMGQADCQAGSVCVGTENFDVCPTGFCCASLCELGTKDCDEGLECVPIPGDFGDVGFCASV